MNEVLIQMDTSKFLVIDLIIVFTISNDFYLHRFSWIQYHISFPIFRLTVAVYYDDMFKSEFGDRAVKRIEAIMAIVDEMYSEKDTLKTELDVKTVAIEHASGKNWGLEDWYSNFAPWNRAKKPEYDLSKIATDSTHDANL